MGLLLKTSMALECDQDKSGSDHESIFSDLILKEAKGEHSPGLEEAVHRLAGTYHKLIHPGHGRQPQDPAHVIQALINASRSGPYAQAVRLMIKAFSPFPPGSVVTLNDGRIGRVMAVHPDFPQEPTVEILDAHAASKRPRIEDLRLTPYLRIEVESHAVLNSDTVWEGTKCPVCQGERVVFSHWRLLHWLRSFRRSSKRCCLECGHHWNEFGIEIDKPIFITPLTAILFWIVLVALLIRSLTVELSLHPMRWAQSKARPYADKILTKDVLWKLEP